jgi:CPA2 family monovalent cation:H+ antiporter-2/glutathione-regulated potassium-efflux system protein KefB
VAQILIAAEIQVTLIDTDVDMIDVAQEFGAKVYFGDGTRIDLLRQAGAAEAELIAFCIDGDQVTEEFLHGVHAAFPNAEIVVRAFDRRTMLKLKDAPVRRVVREVMESAIAMGRTSLEALDVSRQDIEHAEAAYRGRDKERLKAQYETGDLASARDRIFTQAARDAH